jgi:hypothetical protein
VTSGGVVIYVCDAEKQSLPGQPAEQKQPKGETVLDRFSLRFSGAAAEGAQRSSSRTLPGRAPGGSIRRRMTGVMTGVMLLRCKNHALRNGLRQSGGNSRPPLRLATQGSAPMLSVGVNTKNRINNTGFVYDAAGNLTADGSP